MDNIRVLIPEEEVDKKIREMAAEISQKYEGRTLHLVCVLRGGAFFMCELAKRLTVPVTIDFMSVSSYGDGTESSGQI
ncbi:MAG: hypoxanthine phosphoribosyltransferase, partial [Lachnospiraceae bacterium]|nr:hypoxanthine phosphoribosyltransferase [Lachnospiraceae bacterium]